jgi:hypothetical protein
MEKNTIISLDYTAVFLCHNGKYFEKGTHYRIVKFTINYRLNYSK